MFWCTEIHQSTQESCTALKSNTHGTSPSIGKLQLPEESNQSWTLFAHQQLQPAHKNTEQEKSFPLVTWHSGEVLQHWGTAPSWSSSPQTQIQTFKYPHADEGYLPRAGSSSTSQQKSDEYSILLIRTDAGNKLFVQFHFDDYLSQ